MSIATNNGHAAVSFLLDEARKARAHGISIVPPTEDGVKRPDGRWKRFQETPATDAQLERWYGPRTGIGFICGRVSGGLECFEFDDAEAYRRFKEAAEVLGLADLVARVEDGYCEVTPGGGVHWLYRAADIRGNTKLAERPDPAADDPHRRRPLIETRGEGGFVIVSPSFGQVHPSGKAYRLVSGGVESIAELTAEEREILWDLARSFDETPKPEASGGREGVGHQGGEPGQLRPGDDFNARAAWDEILAGWANLGGPGVTYWRRPGKDRGASATTGFNGADLLYVFSSSTPLEPGRWYRKFEVYARLHHNGDFSAAARELAQMGYGASNGKAGRRGPPPKASTNGNGKAPSQETTAEGRDDRPVIQITTEEHEVIDQAVAAIAVDANVYQRSNMLMTVLRDVAMKGRDIVRPPNSPVIAPLPLPRLRELLTRRARWEAAKKRDGDWVHEPAHPPQWAVAGVASRGAWPEIRPIEAVIETPVLRLDGSILDRPGYDERTALLFEPDVRFPPIPTAPTLADARKAAADLLNLVVDFPFAGDDHRAAWLASLLTPMARFGIAGPCPLFLFDANAPGTGKSKLTDVVAMISAGREMPRTTYPDTNDEMRKRISSIALVGDRLMLLDNVDTTFGGSALDSALTAMTWRDRILGRSEMTAEMPLFTVWYATGNNVRLRGDVLRRIVPCRLETREERPEERSDFAIKDLMEHVNRERPRLVAAALTILRAHSAAGRPSGGWPPLGSFEAWDLVVRSAVHWATGHDPCQTREQLRSGDPEALARVALIEGWLDLEKGRSGVKVADALKEVKNDATGRLDNLKDVLLQWSRNDELPSARSIGMRLNALKGRVINGKYFSSADDGRGTQEWRVEFTDRPA